MTAVFVLADAHQRYRVRFRRRGQSRDGTFWLFFLHFVEIPRDIVFPGEAFVLELAEYRTREGAVLVMYSSQAERATPRGQYLVESTRYPSSGEAGS